DRQQLPVDAHAHAAPLAPIGWHVIPDPQYSPAAHCVSVVHGPRLHLPVDTLHEYGSQTLPFLVAHLPLAVPARGWGALPVALGWGGALWGPVAWGRPPAGAVAEPGVAARGCRRRRAPALRRPAVRNRRAHAVRVSGLRCAAGVAAAGAAGVAAIRVDTETRL